MAPDGLEGFLAGAGGQDLVAQTHQVTLKGAPDRLLVVHDQQAEAFDGGR